jgi:hypothetical protein
VGLVCASIICVGFSVVVVNTELEAPEMFRREVVGLFVRGSCFLRGLGRLGRGWEEMPGEVLEPEDGGGRTFLASSEFIERAEDDFLRRGGGVGEFGGEGSDEIRKADAEQGCDDGGAEAEVGRVRDLGALFGGWGRELLLGGFVVARDGGVV